jgi:hypothetical protein
VLELEEFGMPFPEPKKEKFTSAPLVDEKLEYSKGVTHPLRQAADRN